MSNAAFDIPEREALRQQRQVALDQQRSDAERNRLGQFATPNPLAMEMARCVARDWPKQRRVRFADPSIGTGSFYSALRSVFDSTGIESGTGIELDERLAAAARDLWREAGLEVREGDFTKLVGRDLRDVAPNLVLANPPYVRHHHLDRDEKERLQRLVHELCGVQVNGLAGLYVYFLLLCTAWMQEEGTAAWLIPSEFMDVNYGAALRQFLTARVTLDRVHRFDPNDVQFGDALVSSVVLFFRKRPPPAGHAVVFTFGGVLEAPSVSELVPVETLAKARKWTVYPSHPDNDRRLSTTSADSKLSDLFHIQRGIATGSNKFFIMEHGEALQRGLPSECLRPILPSPRHLKVTVIEGDDEGYPDLDSRLCVIDCDLSETIVEARYPELWRYLQTAESLGIRERYLVGKRAPWYRQEQRAPAPFLCTYMGRGSADKLPFRFVWNRSQAIATNLYLMLYPRPPLATMLRKNPQRAAQVFQLLNEVTGNELRGEGRVYGGGLNKIEPAELGRISANAICAKWPELESHVRRPRVQSLFA